MPTAMQLYRRNLIGVAGLAILVASTIAGVPIWFYSQIRIPALLDQIDLRDARIRELSEKLAQTNVLRVQWETSPSNEVIRFPQTFEGPKLQELPTRQPRSLQRNSSDGVVDGKRLEQAISAIVNEQNEVLRQIDNTLTNAFSWLMSTNLTEDGNSSAFLQSAMNTAMILERLQIVKIDAIMRANTYYLGKMSLLTSANPDGFFTEITRQPEFVAKVAELVEDLRVDSARTGSNEKTLWILDNYLSKRGYSPPWRITLWLKSR